MNKKFAVLFSLVIFIVTIGSAQFGGPSKNVKISLQADKKVAAPGETINLVITLDHNRGYNTYWINPGTGLPTDFGWILPPGFETSDPLWKTPKIKLAEDKTTSHIYTGETHILASLEIPANAVEGEVTIGVEGNWLECKGACIPSSGSAELKLTIGSDTKPNPSVEKLAKEVLAEQPIALDNWKIAYGGDDKTFALKLTPGEGANANPGKLYFYEADKKTKLGPVEPTVAKQGNDWVLLMPKKPSDDPADSKDIKGFVYAPNGWATKDGKVIKSLSLANKTLSDSEIKIEGFKPVLKGEGHAETAESSAEDIAAGAALYDKDAKPKYVGGGWKPNIWTGIGGIFLAGIILNLMPCVFPVLAIKIMGFVSQAGESPAKVRAHGLIFGLGVLISMWILAAIILAFNLNWGDQMQVPAFVAGIIVLMFILGLNMAGVFEFGTSMTSVGGELQNKSGVMGSFFSGVLTTLIATPCSGPFLGVVMAFALSQESKIVSLVIFTFFAFGIAFPYAFLSFFPKLIEKMPPPGAWMEALKKGMSFALFATVVFFLSAFSVQTGYDGTKWLLFGLVGVGLAFWVFGTWGTPFISKGKRLVIGYGMTLLCIAISFVMIKHAVDQKAPKLAGASTQSFTITNDDGTTETHSITWEKWYPGVMELARKKKRIVWVDYTADW